MITLEQYFGHKEHTDAQEANATDLLQRVNALLAYADAIGIYGEWICPNTGTQISGSHNGAGDGGFRLSNATTGMANSKHKNGQAVDVFDPRGTLDKWLTDAVLELYDLYREHPDSTSTWAHLQSVPPGSGHRTFYP